MVVRRATSSQVASQLYHGGFATGPEAGFWRDSLGHAWWGEPPAGEWEAAAEGDRVVTLRRYVGRDIRPE